MRRDNSSITTCLTRQGVHLHCVVSGGGISNGQWVTEKRANGKFLFPLAAITESGYKQWKVYLPASKGRC